MPAVCLTNPLRQNEEEVLSELRRLSARHPDMWFRPMDVGGHDASHHSHTLAKLVRKGLAERRKRRSIANVIAQSRRGSWEYRATAVERPA